MANGIVLGGSLYCRKSPSSSAAYYGRFASGTLITANTISGNSEWYETSWNGSTGYVMARYVARKNDTVIVTGNDVNVRSGPGTNHTALYTLDANTTATVIDITSQWVQIDPPSNNAGWMNYAYLEKSSSSSGGTTGGSNEYTIIHSLSLGIATGGCHLYTQPIASSAYQYSGIGSAGGIFDVYTYAGTNEDSWLLYLSVDTWLFLKARYAVGNVNSTDAGSIGTINANDVSLREVPSTNNNQRFASLSKGARYRYFAQKNGWYRILTPYGMGWVYGQYFDPD